MGGSRYFLLFGASAIALVSCAMTSPAAAQDGQPGGASVSNTDTNNAASAEIGEIIVTAQKRSERLRDVPMSVTAATAETLASRGVNSSEDLGKLVPGFSFQKTQFGLPVFFLRGVGFSDTALTASPAVTVYTDQVPLPYLPMARGAVLDIERVEVLKGPQGTLFGQNSTGGAINYIAAKPTDYLAVGTTLTLGRFNQVDAEAFVSGPITDTLSARIAVRREYQDDWQRNRFNGDESGAKDFINGRLIVDWRPSDRATFSLQASAWKDRSDSQQPQFVGYEPKDTSPLARPVDPKVLTYSRSPDNARIAGWTPGKDYRQNNRLHQFALRGQIDISDNVQLSSITAYGHYDAHGLQDIDGLVEDYIAVTIGGTIKNFSQELRLSGDLGHRVKWMVGGSYQDDKINERVLFAPDIDSSTHVGPFTFDSFGLLNNQKIKTKGVFGSLDYTLTDTISLQASARYSDQKRRFQGCSVDLLGTGEFTTAFSLGFFGDLNAFPPGSCVLVSSTTGRPLPGGSKSNLNEDSVSWRAGVSWKPNRATTLYANITKGYKAGSYPTLPTAFDNQLNPVPQESVLAYEAGGKLSLLDRAVDLEFAGFYYDYRDKQLQGLVSAPPFGNLPALVSIAKSRIAGAEANLILNPVEGFRITVGGTYLDTNILQDPVNPTGPFGNVGTFVGESFPYTSKWQGMVDAEYRFHMSANASVFLGATVNGRTGTKGVLYTNATPAISLFERQYDIPGYALLDLRAGIEFDREHLRLEAWGRNVMNEFYLVNTVRGSDYSSRFTGMPATYGLTLRWRYDAR
jgi:outer membrane receptor protein involved in Fe transport